MNTEEKPDATAIKREAELLVALRNHLISAVEEAQSYKYFVWHNSALSMPHVHRANELSAALVDKLAWVKCRLSEVAAATRADQGYVEPSPTNSDLTTECQVLRAEVDKVKSDQCGVVAEASRQVEASDSLYRKVCAERDAALAKLDEVTKNRDYWRETSFEKDKWLETGKKWKAQLAAARADTERLNWLEKAATEDHPSFPMLDNGEWCYPLIVGQGTVHAGVGTCVFKTIRAAIDSAKEG